MLEYEAPRSVSPTPVHSPMRAELSSGNLSTTVTAAAAMSTPVETSNLTTGATAGGTAYPSSAVSVSSTPSYSTAPPAAPAPAAAAPAVVHNPHASVNLLDWDEPAPVPAAATTAPTVPKISMIECAGRFTPVLFQQLWSRLAEAFAGSACTLSRRPSSTAEVEAALRTQKVRLLCSSPLFPYIRSNLL